jgi:hypothetical protein
MRSSASLIVDARQSLACHAFGLGHMGGRLLAGAAAVIAGIVVAQGGPEKRRRA